MTKRLNVALIALFLASTGNIALAQSNGNYGKNIISLAPLAVTDQGVGFGLAYERSLDSKGMFSFYLPLAYSFRIQEDNYYGSQYYDRTEYMFYAYPGIKVYPTGAFGKVRYGIGPSLVIGTGSQYDDRYYSQPYPYTGTMAFVDRFILGTMINNSLNINPTNRLHLGLELGLGVTYVNKIGGRNYGTQPLVQSAFKIGYRF